MTSDGASPAAALRFGRFELRPAERLLLADDRPAALGSRAFDVLLALVEHRSRVVSRSELIELAWPGLVVEENNLSVQITTLRKLLGQQAIATVPGRGYRFTATQNAEPGADRPDIGFGAVASAPPDPALRTNLPEVLSKLIGRDADLVALGALVDAHRLITIVGSGGAGKTRLAEHLLHERRQAYEHGVAWVDMAGLSDPTFLSSTIAGALGLQTGNQEPLAGLVAALKPLQMLIALDNAEHLADEVSRVARALFAGAPQLRLVVTSQVPLKLPIEHVYRLDALAVPGSGVAFDEASRYGAVELFVERAQAADRRFELTPHSLPAVALICERLDGLPLAIELAAARVPMLGLTALAASLDERLRVLTTGHRGAPQRQRTLRAALEWSHGLLSTTETIVFRRLAVFVSGFSLEMARQVVADNPAQSSQAGPLDEWGVADALGSLVDRSLVSADTAQWPRYRLLESARAFALERLASSGEEADLRRRHARAVQERFEYVDSASLGGLLTVDAALVTLEPDLDNAREAMSWSLGNDDLLGAVAMAAPMSFAMTTLRYQEQSRLWEITERLVGKDVPNSIKAAWAIGCSGYWQRRKPALGVTWARAAIALCRQLGDRTGLYRSLAMLIMCARGAEHRTVGAAACDEMLRIEDPDWSARLKYLGAQAEGLYKLLQCGDPEAARAAFQRAKRLAAAAGHSRGAQNTLATLADVALAAGRIDDAVREGFELERLLQVTRNQSTLAYVRVNLTGALVEQGALAQAREMAQAAWPMAVELDLKNGLADNFTLLAALDGRPRTSARLRGYADSIYAAYGAPRESNESRAIAKAEQLSREELGDPEFDRLRCEGASLCDDDALAIAVGASDTDQ